jgi:hypothetical protein
MAVRSPRALLGDDGARLVAWTYARDFKRYIQRWYDRRQPGHPTLGSLCARFRLSARDIQWLIEQAPQEGVVVSHYALQPPKGDTWGDALVAAWMPQLIEDGVKVPVRWRVVTIIDGDDA